MHTNKNIERAIKLISAGEIDFSGLYDGESNNEVSKVILAALREKAKGTNKSEGEGEGFIAVYNPGTLRARAEVHYNEPYVYSAADAYFEALSLDLECNIQIFDLETGEHVMLHAGRPLI